MEANPPESHRASFLKKLRTCAKLLGTTHPARLLDFPSIALRRFLANLFRGDFHVGRLARFPKRLKLKL